MPSIDERVVAMAFENAKFEAAVAVTMATLAKLDTTLKNIGSANSLGDIEKAASKVTLEQPMSALDKLRTRLQSASQGAAEGLGGIEQAGNKVTLETPMSALDKLRARLGTVGAGAADGFSQIESASNGVNLQGLSAAIDSTSNKFSILQGAAAVALGNIVSQAVNTGSRLAKSLTLEPVTAGFANYETQINAVQTIMANTGLTGQQGLGTVSKSLNELNTYANQTVYNFSEMAKNIGTFTAAGVNLNTATESIKGIANLAALSGSNSQQASSAMYQLSQAIAAGKVNLQDWNSVVNSGMGGQVFQKALFDTGKAMGTITNSPVGQTFEEWKKAGNSFRQSLSATNKAAQDGTSAVTKAQKDGAQAVKDAQAAAADANEAAAKRVKDAQASQADAVESAAKRVKDAQASQADAVSSAADRVKQAQDTAAEAATNAAEKVKAAEQGVSDAAKQSATDLKDAQAAQKETFAQSANDVKAALDSVTEAQKRLADAMKPPSADAQQAAVDQLTGAQLDQQDLATAVTDAQREQKRSVEDLAAAQKHLADVRANGGSADEILSAARAVEDAQKRQADDADAVERAILKQNAATRDLHDAQQNLTDVQNQGTDSDQKVLDARDALTVATDNYAKAQNDAAKANLDAEQKITDVRLKGIADQKQAAKDLTDAEKAQSKTLIANRKAIADAEEAQAKTIIDSQNAVVEAEKAQAKTIKDSRESVAEAETAQAKTIIDSRKKVVAAEQASAEKIKTARASLNGGQSQGPPSWLTSDVLTNTLKQFTGDLSAAQLKAQGFNDEQIKAIMQTAKVASGAATNIKTFSQLSQALKEEVGSAWATVFKTLFGDIFSATKLFSGFHNVAQNALTGPVYDLNKVLQGWSKLGGRNLLIEGLKNGFKDLEAVIQPVKDAFRDIFPPTTAQGLLDATKKFEKLTEALKPSQETVDNLRRTFRGFFAVLHIGWTIVKDVVGVIGDLLGVAGKGSGSFLGITGSIGDFLTALDKALTKGGLLKKFFDGISTVLQQPVKLFGMLGRLIGGLFGGVDGAKAASLGDSMDKVGKAAGPLTPILEHLKQAWDGMVKVFEQAKNLASPWLDTIGAQISNLGSTIGNALSNLDFNKVMGALQTAFIGGIFLALKKAISGSSGELTGALSGLNKVFEGLTGNLEAMQQKVKAQTILLIATSIGVLAASTYVLATIDPKRLASALAAMAVGLGELMGAVKLMTSGMGIKGIALLPVLGAGLILVAAATVIIAGAMKIFATMKWEDIAKGMVGMGGGLAAIGIGLSAIGPGALIKAPALIAIAIAMNLLALAVKQFAGMKWQDLARGIAGVFGALVATAVPLSTMGPGIILIGPGLIAVAIGMNLMAKAVAAFGSMDPKKMAIGIIGLSAALVALGLAIQAIPPTVALQAAGLVILSIALAGIAGAVALMGNLKVGTLVKGLAALGGVLVILAVGLSAMSGTLPGSVALLAAAGALAILAPTLGFMGTLNWGTIFKGLAAMALVLGTLAIVGTVASSGLISLGIALLPLAAVLVITAGGVFLFAKALALLGDAGTKGIAVMVAAITAFVALIPTLIINFIKGLVDITSAIADIAPKIVTALGAILDQMIAFVTAQAPKIAIAVGALVDAFLQVLVDNSPNIIAAGFKLLIDLLTGIDQNIQEVVARAASVIVNFLNTLASKAPDLTAAGGNFLVSMLNGLAAQLPKLATAAIGLVTSFLTAIIGQFPKILLQGATMVANLITGILGKVKDVVAAGLSMVLNVITGIGNALPRIVKVAGDVIIKFVNALADVGPKLVDAGFKALITFLHGVAQAIRDNNQDLADAGVDIASAIIDGLIDGLSTIGAKLVKPAVEKLFDLLPKWARKVLGINSPSTVFMEIGKYSAEGVVVGLQNGTSNVASAASGIGDAAVSALQKSMSKVGTALDTGINSNPTITPVLDLTDVKSGIGDLNKMTTSSQLAVLGQYSSGLGSAVSSETQSQANGQDAVSGSATPLVTFEQNNYSPESLSPAEIYRQTQNQLSQVKSALGFATTQK